MQWSEGLGKSQSGSDFAEFVRQKAIELEQLGSAENAEKDSVVGTAGTADNWEQFKGLIKPAVGEYVKLLRRSVRRRLTKKEGLRSRATVLLCLTQGLCGNRLLQLTMISWRVVTLV